MSSARTVVTQLFVGLVSCSTMQPSEPAGSRGLGSDPDTHLYDLQTMESDAGEITAIERVAPASGMPRRVDIMLKTDEGEDLPVRLGPEWYVDLQNVPFQRGDKVQVSGSRVTVQGKPLIIADTLTRGDLMLYLRDSHGLPAWEDWP